MAAYKLWQSGAVFAAADPRFEIGTFCTQAKTIDRRYCPIPRRGGHGTSEVGRQVIGYPQKCLQPITNRPLLLRNYHCRELSC